MGKVVLIQQDVLRDIYQEMKEIRRQLRRLQARDITFQVQAPNGQTYTYTSGDGTNWIDPSDGTLHYVFGGVEYKLTGTAV